MGRFKIFVVCMFVLAPASVWTHTGDVYFARETRAIEVDGNLDEWPENVWREATHYQEILGKPSDKDDFQAWFAVMWNQDRIFLAARVKDDIHECRWFGTYISDEDHVRFSFIPEHAPDRWQTAVLRWQYALSSTGDSVMVGPSGRFAQPPRGVTFVAHKVVRDAQKRETYYEAAVEVPFAVEAGMAYGFGFSAKDDDGFPEGTYAFAPGSLTLPGIGGGDLVFVSDTVDPVHILGQVSGQTQAPVYVHAFQKEKLKGSALCDAEGRFDLLVLPGDYTLEAWSGDWRSAPRDVKVEERAIQDFQLELSERGGTIAGWVTLQNATTPVPLAGVLALQGREVRARTYTDDQGRYEITGLNPGVYNLVSPVAMGDTVESVHVKMDAVTEAPRNLRATETFSRLPAEDDVFEVMKQVFEYDKKIPFDTEITERRQIAGYVREKIVFTSTHDERVPGYLALPGGNNGPYPCVVTLHAGAYTGKDRSDFELLRRRLTAIGYAVLALDAKYYNERQVNGKFGADFPGQIYRRRDAIVQTVVDYRRALDYLATRSEIDTTRIGIYGGSMGTFHGSYLAAFEPRIKAFVMRGPGLGHDRWNTTVQINDTLHYVARIGEIPVILFSGYYDNPWAVQGTLRLLDLLQGPTKIIWYNTTHTVPPALYVDEMLAWLKEHL